MMDIKTYIITLKSNADSSASAMRTMQSAVNFGQREVYTYAARTPENFGEVLDMSKDTEFWKYPRPANVAACFASHLELWRKCIELNETILILEHDAIFIKPLPHVEFDKCITFGRPSYIRTNHIATEAPVYGVQILRDVNFLGHHAYMIKPEAAKIFVDDYNKGTRPLSPNDLWMSKEEYPWLEEHWPCPVIADTDFSTVQDDVPYNSPIASEYDFGELHKNRKFLQQYYPNCLEKQSYRFIKA
jgi:GR25 family glycosyltransferase involved in LPS biosynthesis